MAGRAQVLVKSLVLLIYTEVLEKTTCKCLFISIHLEKLPFEQLMQRLKTCQSAEIK